MPAVFRIISGKRNPESFREILREYLRTSQPFVLLDTSLIREDETTSYFFKDPVEQLILSHEAGLSSFFHAVGDYLRKGYWLAGWFAYEFGYLFEERLHHLLSLKCPSYPLAWLGVFEQPLIFHHTANPRRGAPYIPDIQGTLHIKGF